MMGSSSHWFSTSAFTLMFFISIFSLIIFSVNGQSFLYQICGNETADANYKTDLASLLDSLSSKASTNTFYNDTLNQIYSLYLCRGDVNTTTCQRCVKTASQEILEKCESNKTAIIWYDECMLRYSNDYFFGIMNTRPGFIMYNVQNRSDPGDRDVGALSLMDKLRGVTTNSKLMFDTYEIKPIHNKTLTLYGLAQCTRDIDKSSCYECLKYMSDRIGECCQDKVAWRFQGPNCNIRYEQYRFYDEVPTDASPPPLAQPPPSLPPPPPPPNSGNNTIKIVVITASGIAGAAVVLGFFLYFTSFSRKSTREASGEQISAEIPLNILNRPTKTHFMEGHMHDQDNTGETYYFNLTTILAATNNFSDSNKLGEGGFGPVYKGTLPNGKEIAIKRLSMKSGQGIEEFRNEVMVIAKLQHKNLVRLLGCCIKGDEKLLVYEYMANTSLDAFLFDPTKAKQLDWAKRASIIGGIARGLLYLHEDSRLKIIHRDMKASNVLLDDEMNPKISDFGTARIFVSNQIEASTNRIIGTFGYMAPEYAMHGQFSAKTDVYSFGVLVLEILTGQRNNHFHYGENAEHLLSYAWTNWKEGTATNIVDPMLRVGSTSEVIMKYIHIGLLCVQQNEAERPTMASVVLMLNGQSPSLPVPSHPAFFIHNCSQLGMPLGIGLDQPSVAKVTITDPHPR